MEEQMGGANLYTLVDEEGKEQVFEMLDSMEVDDKVYYALTPYYEDPNEQLDSDGELVVLVEEEVDGEMYMATIEDDEEYERIGALFIDRLAAMFDDEDEDEEEDEE